MRALKDTFAMESTRFLAPLENMPALAQVRDASHVLEASTHLNTEQRHAGTALLARTWTAREATTVMFAGPIRIKTKLGQPLLLTALAVMKCL